MTKVFKIVRQRGPLLISFMAEPGYGGITYEQGVITLPPVKGSRLFAFSNYEDAFRFYDNNGHDTEAIQLWEAEGNDPTHLFSRTWTEDANGMHTGSVIKNMEAFWGGEKQRVFKMAAPNGTVGCLPIQLTERLL